MSNPSTFMDLPDHVMEGEQGWVLQGVLSCAIRRPPVSGQKYFAVLSLHISNIYEKKGIAKKFILTFRADVISQEVASDFNCTAWQYRGIDNLSTIDEAFMDSILPTTGPHTTEGIKFHSR